MEVLVSEPLSPEATPGPRWCRRGCGRPVEPAARDPPLEELAC